MDSDTIALLLYILIPCLIICCVCPCIICTCVYIIVICVRYVRSQRAQDNRPRITHHPLEYVFSLYTIRNRGSRQVPAAVDPGCRENNNNLPPAYSALFRNQAINNNRSTESLPSYNRLANAISVVSCNNPTTSDDRNF